MEERVQKILSEWGIASRRRAEAMILAGRVQCNGTVVKLGQKADPGNDTIKLMARAFNPPSVRNWSIYYFINQPE
jgi:23S rRNA pseudouridine2605 synthase